MAEIFHRAGLLRFIVGTDACINGQWEILGLKDDF
jgi:hypothetical protein